MVLTILKLSMAKTIIMILIGLWNYGNLIGLGGNNEGFGVGLENVEIGNGQFVGENAAGEV